MAQHNICSEYIRESLLFRKLFMRSFPIEFDFDNSIICRR
tara:strand:+ start:132 stop:251 length:120 start_codon:yes stop_codon:yes gene_type:complete